MQKISTLSYIDLLKNILNKQVHFTSDCEFFPNFDVRCIVYNISLSKNNNEILMDVKILNSNKKITIGSNMKNLQFEFI